MINKLAKTRHQSISQAELEGGAPRTSASSTQAVLPWKQQRQALKTLKANTQTPDKNLPGRGQVVKAAVQGDGILFNNNGFTLIELLVVVLIIGILAGVALPQYNKAVRKARLSEAATTFNSLSKAIDMWLLENSGFPADNIYLCGENRTSLDIKLSCAKENSLTCYTKIGGWSCECQTDHCQINLATVSNADGTSGNEWLDRAYLEFQRYADGQWGINMSNVPSSVQRDVCQWWKSMYGPDRVIGSGGNASSECNAYF